MTAVPSTDARPIWLTNHSLYSAGVPHELFRELREQAPVHWHGPADVPVTNPPEGVHTDGFWAVLGHPEIAAVNRDSERFIAGDGPGLAPFPPEMRGTALIWMDAPDHTRLRKLVSSGFTPRMLGRLDDLLVRRSAQIIDAAIAKGESNFVSEVAYQLPMHVIADIMGIPEDERPYVFRLTERMLKGSDVSSDITAEASNQAQIELFQYAESLSARKQQSPAADVWTELTTASTTTDDGGTTRLAKHELDFFFIILAIAGSETTRNALSQGVLALLQHQDQLVRLRAEPGLLSSAVDEIIRWSSPVLYFGRTALDDVEVGGMQIRAGDRVTMWYPAGNRDPRTFVDPDLFDITRSPNPHISFGGGGAHYCLGANLAKREVHVLVDALMTRCADVELIGDPVWGGGGAGANIGVSLNELPVRLAPR